jgi:signal transduction histidine kinase/DNA-binding NarL/FixJ family response regulator
VLTVRLLRKDGGIVWTEQRLVRIFDAEGNAVSVEGVVRDVTERKELQEHLLRAQRLETAGRVAGQVAHDFNNLLAPIMGFAELLKMRVPGDPQAQEYCDMMITAAQQIAEVNEDLLALGRRGYFERRPVPVSQLVMDVVAGLGTPPATLAVETSLDPEAFAVLGSSAQLMRVLTNLVSNAREAMGDIGTLRIVTENVYLDHSLGRYAAIEPGEYLRLEVTDTGPGVTPDVMTHMFDAFFTTKGAARRRGAGLGLSVVQSVVDDHRGYLVVDSAVGHGATFSIYLPAWRGEIEETTAEQAPRGSESILVVDDDPVQRSLLTDLLRTLGYRAEPVGSGEAAIALLRKRTFDLLVLDMVMPPGIDGAETYRGASTIRRGQRAIILSGYSESDRVALAQELGAGTYLRKPVTLPRLAQAVRAELDLAPALLRGPSSVPARANRQAFPAPGTAYARSPSSLTALGPSANNA